LQTETHDRTSHVVRTPRDKMQVVGVCCLKYTGRQYAQKTIIHCTV